MPDKEYLSALRNISVLVAVWNARRSLQCNDPIAVGMAIKVNQKKSPAMLQVNKAAEENRIKPRAIDS